MSTATAGDTATSTAQRVRPRPVFCPTEHLHRDLALADDAVAGAFTYGGTRLRLALPPDWVHDGLAQDEEWHIEWSKFSYGLDLAHAYRLSGEPRYLQTWQLLVESWIEQRSPDADTSDVTARRLQHWLYAWQGFDAAPGFGGLEPGFERRLLDSFAAQLAHVRATLSPERNHRTLELFALLVVPLALPGLDPDGTAADQAWDLLEANLLEDVWADGVHRERSTHYHLIALRSFVGARVNRARFGGAVSAAYDERLRAACRFGLHLHRPDGQIPAFSDSDGGSHLDLLALAAQELDDDELRWVSTAGRAGRPPAGCGADFPTAGYYTQRSGWGVTEPFPAERFLLFGAGPLGDGGHGHYDALGIEAYADGRPLVVDPGRYTYAEGDPNWRRWFKGTAAHNTVTVDGADQQPYRRGKPKGARLDCRLLSRWTSPSLDVLHGEVTSPAYDAVHRRLIAFVAGRYWLVADAVGAPTTHEYAVRWHLAGGPDPLLERGSHVRSATTDTVRLDTVGAATVEVEPGWVAREYGVRTPAPVLVARVRGTDADVVTLLCAHRPQGSPTIARSEPALGVAVVALPEGGTDLVGWRGAPVEAGGLSVRAALVLLRRDPAGRLREVALHQPSSVEWSGPGPSPDLAAHGEWLLWREGLR